MFLQQFHGFFQQILQRFFSRKSGTGFFFSEIYPIVLSEISPSVFFQEINNCELLHKFHKKILFFQISITQILKIFLKGILKIIFQECMEKSSKFPFQTIFRRFLQQFLQMLLENLLWIASKMALRISSEIIQGTYLSIPSKILSKILP